MMASKATPYVDLPDELRGAKIVVGYTRHAYNSELRRRFPVVDIAMIVLLYFDALPRSFHQMKRIYIPRSGVDSNDSDENATESDTESTCRWHRHFGADELLGRYEPTKQMRRSS